MEITVTARGTYFQAPVRARVIRAAMDEAEEDVARATVTAVHRRLGQVLQHPTGFYQRHVTADLSHVPPRVWDRAVIYGPWLEGIGSRNVTTRFKGYRTFRLVAQQMQSDAVAISEPRFTAAVKVINR